MTEEEAKTKWCPFDPRAPSPERTDRCIASACMAWRTRPIRSHEQDVMRDGTAVNPPTNSVTLDGFCGLAGAPQ